VALPRGPHAIVVARERYASASSTVEAPGEIDLDLKRPPATMIVTANLPGAAVTIGSTPRGPAPAHVQLPAYESYKVEVSVRGRGAWRKSVYLKAPSTEVRATLR
jgi:hypothetical protein